MSEQDKIQVYKDEVGVILAMRKYGPVVSFKIEKSPTKENPKGELIKVEIGIRHTIRNSDLIIS